MRVFVHVVCVSCVYACVCVSCMYACVCACVVCVLALCVGFLLCVTLYPCACLCSVAVVNVCENARVFVCVLWCLCVCVCVEMCVRMCPSGARVGRAFWLGVRSLRPCRPCLCCEWRGRRDRHGDSPCSLRPWPARTEWVREEAGSNTAARERHRTHERDRELLRQRPECSVPGSLKGSKGLMSTFSLHHRNMRSEEWKRCC